MITVPVYYMTDARWQAILGASLARKYHFGVIAGKSAAQTEMHLPDWLMLQSNAYITADVKTKSYPRKASKEEKDLLEIPESSA